MEPSSSKKGRENENDDRFEQSTEEQKCKRHKAKGRHLEKDILDQLPLSTQNYKRAKARELGVEDRCGDFGHVWKMKIGYWCRST